MRPERPLAAFLLLGALFAVACGGNSDSGGGTQAPESTSTVDQESSPTLAMPASRFALSLDDLPDGYLTDRASTFALTSESYAAGTKMFPSPEEGRQMLDDWGYVGGYETGFEPERRMIGVLNGAYYANVEIHLFRSAEDAAGAQEYFEERLAETTDRVNAPQVGNSSSAWKLTFDTVPGSNIAAVYHRVLFRRGNLFAVVKTYGSDVLMTVDTVQSLARLVDEKAMGIRPAVEPTPLRQPATPTPEPSQAQ